MSFFVKYYNNFRFNKLANLFVFNFVFNKASTHTHTHRNTALQLYFTYQFGNFVKRLRAFALV